MFRTLVTGWPTLSRRALVLLAALLALTLSSGSVLASTRCREVRGWLTLQPLVGEECTSPVGFCVQGTLSGDIYGNFTGIADSFTPLENAPAFLYTSNSVIHTQRGDVTTRVAGLANAAGEFSELQTITAGTDKLAGLAGILRVNGAPSEDGSSRGTYIGTLCLP